MQRKHITALCGALVIAGLTACEANGAPDAEVEPGAEALPPATETMPADETAPGSDAMPGNEEIPAMPGAEADAAASASLTVAEAPEYGAYLADANGRALYLLEADSPGESTCTDACAEQWPPFLAAQGTPTAGGAEVQEDLISTIQREDGSTQVTYDGHPLYYYVEDQGAGQATGQDVTDQWGEWYLVTPAGEPLEEQETGGQS